MAQTPSMTRLIQQLARLPGIGEKTASRLAFHVLRAERSYAQALADALEAYLSDPGGRAKALEVAGEIGRMIGCEITVDENDRSFIQPFIDFARSGEFEIW